MTRKLFWMALILSFVFASGLAFAQEDDDAADDDAADDDAVEWVTFSNPAALEGNTEYEFTFSVFYNAEPEAKGLGIKQVDMNLPGTEASSGSQRRTKAPSGSCFLPCSTGLKMRK